MDNLDPEEQAILEAFETGTLERSDNIDLELEQHQAAAQATFQKNARINIQLSSRDFRSLQAMALSEGISYQALVSSILHKFIEGQLIEKSS